MYVYGHFQGKSVEFLVSCERFCLKIDKYGGWLEVGRAHWLCSKSWMTHLVFHFSRVVQVTRSHCKLATSRSFSPLNFNV